MNYATIKTCDIANGPGVRTSLFVSGCTHHCPNCFNEVAWDFAYGEVFDEAVWQKIFDSCAPGYVTGITLLGGEPMEPANQRALLPFVQAFRAKYPEKSVWCFTGYTLERDLWHSDGSCPDSRAYCEVTAELLSLIDVLIDGEFVAELKNISLRFRGSENQRIIDLPRTREQGSVVLWEG